MRTHHQISEKLKQLKKYYKKVKDNNNLSGRNRISFKFFAKVDRIMGDRPITRPQNLLDSGEVDVDNFCLSKDSFESETLQTQRNERILEESDDSQELSAVISNCSWTMHQRSFLQFWKKRKATYQELARKKSFFQEELKLRKEAEMTFSFPLFWKWCRSSRRQLMNAF